MKTESNLDHGYASMSKYRVEVFENVTGELVGTFKHVPRSEIQLFMDSIKLNPECSFRGCYISVHREHAEKGELYD